MWKEGEPFQSNKEQEQMHKLSNPRNIGTHCNTGKLYPSLNDRIPEVCTIAFLSPWGFVLDVNISPRPAAAHLASIMVSKTSEGR